MPTGAEAGLDPGHIVLDGDPAVRALMGHSPSPAFSAHDRCGQTPGRPKMPLHMEVGLGPGNFVLDGAKFPEKKGHSPPANFWPLSIVTKRVDG